jgi:putative tryptophan/tyrosine transport system substrate-binding protein
MSHLTRREFVGLLGGAAMWPLAARAQQPMPVIGFLHSGSAAAYAQPVTAFRQGLKEVGYVEDRNVAIEYRWAEGRYDRLPALAADLVQRGVSVIASTGGPSPVLAAKAATTTIPIVFSAGIDPVKFGLVASLNRPGGNVTGVNVFTAVIASKRLGLLRELVPTAASIAVLLNPSNPSAETQWNDIQEAASAVGQQVNVLRADSDADLDAAFVSYRRLQSGALLVGADPSFVNRRDRIVALAARHAVPTIYEQREFAVAGGLASYGTSLADAYRQVGIYTGRILKGEKPADLPVIQSIKFELVINLRAAKTIGLEIPDRLLAIADEVIE